MRETVDDGEVNTSNIFPIHEENERARINRQNEYYANISDGEWTYKDLDQCILQAYRLSVLWKVDSISPVLAKAPEIWTDGEVIDGRVFEAVKEGINIWSGVVISEFRGMTSSLENIFYERIISGDGWSMRVLVDSLLDEYEKMAEKVALEIVRGELGVVLNFAREYLYYEIGGGRHSVDWINMDSRVHSPVCDKIKQRVSDLGRVGLDELKEIIADVSESWSVEGALSGQGEVYMPHRKCYNTFWVNYETEY